MSYTVTTTSIVQLSQVEDCLADGHGIAYWCKAADFSDLSKAWVKPYDGPKKRLNIQRGLDLMGKLYPGDLSDLIHDNGDANTEDKLVQLSAFGKLIYG